jgi:hypothetical protein
MVKYGREVSKHMGESRKKEKKNGGCAMQHAALPTGQFRRRYKENDTPCTYQIMHLRAECEQNASPKSILLFL